MSLTKHLNLLPSQLESGGRNEFAMSGRTISSSLSSADNSMAVFVAFPNRSSQNIAYTGDEPVYFASIDQPPSSERRLFITDTSVIFAAFQNLMKTARTQTPEWLETESVQNVIRKLSTDYVNHIKECWVHASQPITRSEPLQFSSEHYKMLYTTFSLFMVLYTPEVGFKDAPVGDDLMEWLNTHYIEPSTEEGDHLSTLDRPWEDETFWPYLTRATIRGLTKAAVFFLEILSRHPSVYLQPFAERLIPLLDTQPRMLNYSIERDFVYASRRWKDKIKAIRVDMEHVPENERHDTFENWWDRLSDLVGVLEGRQEVLMRVCEELGADWKEVVAAWGIFVDNRARRHDLPDIMADILDALPPDPTDAEDMIQLTLFSSDCSKALIHASQLDPWLAAHLADIMQALDLLESEPDANSELSLRDYYTLSYCEYLHSDPALWQLTVAYMCSCAEIGKERADEVLTRVPLRLLSQTQPGASSVDEKIRAGEVVGVLKAVNETCFEYQRERVRRTICRIAAQTFVQEKEYGLAVSYYTSAEDWPGLGRVIDCVLDEYINNGPEKFAGYVAKIAPSLQKLQAQPGPQWVFIHRLIFAVRYAEFHTHRINGNLSGAAWDLVEILHGDIAPKSWWGVILYDAVELLHYPTLLFSTAGAGELFRRLEEIFIRTNQGAGEDYLSILNRVSPVQVGAEQAALHRLKTVRLALAKYFARCTMIGVGGRHVPDHR